jgi:hypothetical protein
MADHVATGAATIKLKGKGLIVRKPPAKAKAETEETWQTTPQQAQQPSQS